MSAINGLLLDTGYGNVLEFLAGAVIGIVSVTAFALIAKGVLALLGMLQPKSAAWLVGSIIALLFLQSTSPAEILRTVFDPASWSLPSVPAALSPSALTLLVLAVAALYGIVHIGLNGTLARMDTPAKSWLTAASVLLVSLGVAVVVDLARDGSDPFPARYHLERGPGEAPPDPSLPGTYRTEFLTYGAGENRRRPEFGTERDLESRSVDATAMLPEWKEFKKRMRESYWGFGLADAPLNGLVWTPLGEGPFPLVLIVHGNHGMEDFSDSGYTYLGELLASRGFITVSVDQNFINGTWSGDFRGKEMPARAWLLLKQLVLWRDWSGDPQHRFYRKADLDNVALMGHSRGGEAVSIAFAYNQLAHFPDDATVGFDFGFGIRSLVAIAQVDQRYHRRVELADVNFFTIHGSYDSDEPAYHGMRQYHRISLSGDDYRFKAGVYLHGANHGQFNTGWGRTDYSPPGSWLLNLAPIIPPQEQQQAAKAFISAFLEATLHDDRRYLAFLKDPRSGRDWLPDRPYVQQFRDSTFTPIADFEEDIDVRTASADGAKIYGNALDLWREEELEHRDRRKQGTNAVVLGWNADSNGEASYTISLDGASAGLIGAGRVLTVSVSGSTESPPQTGDEQAAPEDEGDPASPAFRIELTDAAGEIAEVQSKDHVTLAPPMRVQFLKNKALNDERYNSSWEPILQHFELPLAAIAASNPSFDLESTREIRFRFDQAPEGVIILDDIGIADIL
jgi:hypothetical protein